MEKADGFLTESFTEVFKTFTEYFQGLLGTSNNRPTDFPFVCLQFESTLGVDQQDLMDHIPTVAKIKDQ